MLRGLCMLVMHAARGGRGPGPGRQAPDGARPRATGRAWPCCVRTCLRARGAYANAHTAWASPRPACSQTGLGFSCLAPWPRRPLPPACRPVNTAYLLPRRSFPATPRPLAAPARSHRVPGSRGVQASSPAHVPCCCPGPAGSRLMVPFKVTDFIYNGANICFCSHKTCAARRART